MIDLNPVHLETVQAILAEHLLDCEVRVFGSRATGQARRYSDLDLAIVGSGPIGLRTLGRLLTEFEESDLPFTVDVVDWNSASESFRKAIAKDWVVLPGPSEPTIAT